MVDIVILLLSNLRWNGCCFIAYFFNTVTLFLNVYCVPCNLIEELRVRNGGCIREERNVQLVANNSKLCIRRCLTMPCVFCRKL